MSKNIDVNFYNTSITSFLPSSSCIVHTGSAVRIKRSFSSLCRGWWGLVWLDTAGAWLMQVSSPVNPLTSRARRFCDVDDRLHIRVLLKMSRRKFALMERLARAIALGVNDQPRYTVMYRQLAPDPSVHNVAVQEGEREGQKAVLLESLQRGLGYCCKFEWVVQG